MSDRRVAIVGGGLSGLVCARLLKDSGVDCFVLDRGRNPGGRVGAKSIFHNDHPFLMNHGAPKLDCHEVRSREIMTQLGVRVSDHGIIQCTDMRSVIKQLAAEIPIKSSTEVLRLRREGASWVLSAKCYGQDDEFHTHASDIVFACPSAQASRVLDASGLERPQEFQRVRYASQWVLLLVVESATLASAFEEIQRSVLDGTSIDSIEAAQRVGDQIALVARLSPNRSSELYDTDPESIRAELTDEIIGLLASQKCSVQILESQVHRWGLARGIAQNERAHLCWAEHQISFIGDFFSGARGDWRDADASILSACTLATHLCESEST